MKKKSLKKKADNLVFILLGCAGVCWFFSLLFFPSCRNINQESEQSIEIEEYYDSPAQLPQNFCDSIQGSNILIATGEQENKELLTDKL